MGNKGDKISRRGVLGKVTQGFAVLGFGGFLWGGALRDFSRADLVLRPPGALPEADFQKACIKCGQCVVACPYDSLVVAAPGDGVPNGTPHFIARDIPCYMCTDYPCIEECPSEALTVDMVTSDGKASINNAKMGLAVIHKESCIAYWGIQCDACYRACPLIGEAITLELEQNEQTKKHANIKPVVNSDACTGCGICEHVCVVEKAAIRVLPREIATGEVGAHYLKSWDESDENRIRSIKEKKESNGDIHSTLDYLNNLDGLIDE
ncbi:MAG: ferredoxin-type protein NapG [Chlorobi bacterium]|nr:ferredoxin-type protein NapG [Chlorobiota bacterium]